MTKRKSKPTIGPVEFIDKVIRHDEKGEPFYPGAYQRRVLEVALRRDPSGEADVSPGCAVGAQEERQDLHSRVACLVMGGDQPSIRKSSPPMTLSSQSAGSQDHDSIDPFDFES